MRSGIRDPSTCGPANRRPRHLHPLTPATAGRVTAGSSLPDVFRGEVGNLPAAVAGAALHPPVAAARAVPNLQDGPEQSGIARVPVLALPRVARGRWVERVEPSATVGGLLVEAIDPAFGIAPPNAHVRPTATGPRNWGSAFLRSQRAQERRREVLYADARDLFDAA